MKLFPSTEFKKILQKHQKAIEKLPKAEMAPSFFKIILSSEKVVIPKDSVLQMPVSLANGSIILRDRCNNSWPVGISRDGDEWYFEGGWAQFCKGSCLEFGDFITFKHKGGNLLEFKLYGGNGCGKKGAGGPAMPRATKEEPMDYEPDEEQKQEKKPLDEDGLDYVKEEEEEGDEVPLDYKRVEDEKQEEKSLNEDGFDSVKEEEEEQEQEHEQEQEQEQEQEDDDDDDDNDEQEEWLDDEYDFDSANQEEEDDDDDYVNEEDKEQVNTRNIANSSKVRKRKSNKTNTHKRESRRKTGYCYAYEIFDSGLARRPHSDVPYFVSRSRPKSRKNELFIPKDVIDDYKLKIPEELFLVDEAGKKYETKVKKWNDGRLWCTKGWKILCKKNKIKPNDVCICEFVRKQGSMKIHHLLVRHARGLRGSQ